MKTEYFIYRPSSQEPECGEVDWPSEPGYAVMKALIEPLLDGAYFEHVTVVHEGERRDMFVDEMGAVHGLPVNAMATPIYRHNWLSQHPNVNPDSIPAIYGTAILFSRRVWF